MNEVCATKINRKWEVCIITYVHTRTCIRIYIIECKVCIYTVYIHVHVNINIHTCTHAHTQTHTHTHTHVRTHTHTHTCVRTQLPAEWTMYACGQTDDQRRLTQQARSFLQSGRRQLTFDELN